MNIRKRGQVLLDLRRMMAMILFAFALLLMASPEPAVSAPRLSLPDAPAPSTNSLATDLAALNAWLPVRGAPATLAPRDDRSGTVAIPAYVAPSWRAVGLVALLAALVLTSRCSAVGLRWSRALRGPPALI